MYHCQNYLRMLFKFIILASKIGGLLLWTHEKLTSVSHIFDGWLVTIMTFFDNLIGVNAPFWAKLLDIAILPTMHTTKLSMCTLDYSHPQNKCITHQQGIQQCLLHSLLHMRQHISAMSAMLSLQLSCSHPQHNWVTWELPTSWSLLRMLCIECNT